MINPKLYRYAVYLTRANGGLIVFGRTRKAVQEIVEGEDLLPWITDMKPADPVRMISTKTRLAIHRRRRAR